VVSGGAAVEMHVAAPGAALTPPNSQGVLRAEGMQGWGKAHPLADSQGPILSVRAWQARGTLAEIILTSKSMISSTYLSNPQAARQSMVVQLRSY